MNNVFENVKNSEYKTIEIGSTNPRTRINKVLYLSEIYDKRLREASTSHLSTVKGLPRFDKSN